MTRSVEIGKAMIRDLPVLLLPLFLGVAMITSAQQGGEAPKGTDNASQPGKPQPTQADQLYPRPQP